MILLTVRPKSCITYRYHEALPGININTVLNFASPISNPPFNDVSEPQHSDQHDFCYYCGKQSSTKFRPFYCSDQNRLQITLLDFYDKIFWWYKLNVHSLPSKLQAKEYRWLQTQVCLSHSRLAGRMSRAREMSLSMHQDQNLLEEQITKSGIKSWDDWDGLLSFAR